MQVKVVLGQWEVTITHMGKFGRLAHEERYWSSLKTQVWNQGEAHKFGLMATELLVTDDFRWHCVLHTVAVGFGDTWNDSLQDLRRAITEDAYMRDEILATVDEVMNISLSFEDGKS